MRRPSPSRRRVLLVGATAAAIALTAAIPAAQAARPRAAAGSLVLIGGGLKADNAQVYGEIIDRAGGDKARIGVLTAASVPASQDPDAGDPDKCSNSECNGRYYADLFKQHGAAAAEWIPVDLDHIDNADSDAVVRQVESMTGFFFGGGDQYRYVTTLLHGDEHTDSKVLAAIRSKLRQGAVVSGTSAGAQIAAGRDMVTGGESYEGLRDGSEPGYFDDATKLGYLPEGGFGFLRSGLVDTHTGAFGREGRAIRLAADTGHDRVFALEENTALVVDRAGTRDEALRVLGPRGVGLLDLRDVSTRDGRDGWSASGVRYSYLTGGDRYSPRSWMLRPSDAKTELTDPGSDPVPRNEDVFFSAANPSGVPYSFLGTARALAATDAQETAEATTYESGPRFTVTFTKGRGFRAWTEDGETAKTVENLRISVAPR